MISSIENVKTAAIMSDERKLICFDSCPFVKRGSFRPCTSKIAHLYDDCIKKILKSVENSARVEPRRHDSGLNRTNVFGSNNNIIATVRNGLATKV